MRPTDVARIRTAQPGATNGRLVRRGFVPAAVLAGALGATTNVAAASLPQQPVVTTAKIAGLGTILVASHRPLYEMASDPEGHATCTGTCAKNWKPLIVTHKQAHHLGKVSGLGTIHRSRTQLQVAIHGHALYFFSGDHSESHAGGQGLADNWFTVHSDGTLDRTTAAGTTVTVPSTAPPPASPSSPSPSSSSSSSSSASTTTRPTSAPSSPAPSIPPPSSPASSGSAPTDPPATSPPPTSPPPPRPTTTTVPPTTPTTTGSSGGGGVGF